MADGKWQMAMADVRRPAGLAITIFRFTSGRGFFSGL
jgi:hypothetical protein